MIEDIHADLLEDVESAEVDRLDLVVGEDARRLERQLRLREGKLPDLLSWRVGSAGRGRANDAGHRDRQGSCELRIGVGNARGDARIVLHEFDIGGERAPSRDVGEAAKKERRHILASDALGVRLGNRLFDEGRDLGGLDLMV